MLPHPVIETRFKTEAQKPDFVNQLFDRGAQYYDGVNSWGFLGTGGRYRRMALFQHGLRAGQRLLDVGCGTGLIAIEAVKILGTAENITCVDPSVGMLAVAKLKLNARFVQGRAEEIPLPDESFDFLTMGYALRHVTSLDPGISRIPPGTGERGESVAPGDYKAIEPTRGGRVEVLFQRCIPLARPCVHAK